MVKAFPTEKFPSTNLQSTMIKVLPKELQSGDSGGSTLTDHPHFHGSDSEELPCRLFTLRSAVRGPRSKSNGPIRTASSKHSQMGVLAFQERH